MWRTILVVGLETAPDQFAFILFLSLDDRGFQARIAHLRALVADLEGRVVSNRAYSREILPPMDGTTVF